MITKETDQLGNILIVDDEPINLRLLSLILSKPVTGFDLCSTAQRLSKLLWQPRLI